MNSRISRGFHRIGIVLAVLMLLAAGRSAGQEMWLQWMLSDPYVAAEDDPAPASAQTNHVEASGMSNPAERTTPRVFYRPNYLPAIRSLFLAFVLYAAARAVGWALDRYMSQAGRIGS